VTKLAKEAEVKIQPNFLFHFKGLKPV